MMQFAFTNTEFAIILGDKSKRIDGNVQRTVKAQPIFEHMLAKRKQSIILFLFLRLCHQCRGS